LPEMLRRLAAKHEEGVRASRRALMATLYPLAVAHFAVLAFPIKVAIVDGDLMAYGWAVLKILIPFWLLGLVFFFAVRQRLRPAVAVLDFLPLVGGYRRARAIADLAFVLETQVVAGISLDVAWLRAALAAGDRRLETLAIQVAETVQQGQPVSVAIAGRAELPSPFAAFWGNGEQTGSLDNSLKHLHRHFSEIAARKLMLASLVYPKVLFALIAVWVAIQIVSFYAGYFRQFEELM
ncbi:MAG: type II secretion system F family protein, partial [Opitutaceae bacterium]